MFRHATVLSLLVGAGAFVGCVQVSYQANPEFCTNARGDETCAERFPDGSRPYCVVSDCLDDFYGCFPDVPGENCASPCGLENPDCTEGMTAEGSTGTTTEGTTDETMTSTGESSTTGPEPCMSDGDCTDSAAPFCEPESSVCVGCDGMAEPDMACAGLEAGTPVCVEGECRQCTSAMADECMGMTPVCDDGTNTCVPCTDHDQCGEPACNLFTGECLPPEVVLHVGPGQEFPTIAQAVDSFFGLGEQGTVIVHGNGSFDESVVVSGERVVAILANDGDSPRWTLTGGGIAQLTVNDGTALVDGMQISSNGDDVGVLVNGGSAWIDDSRVITNFGGGIRVQSAGELVLRNCFVGSLGEVIGVEVDGATAEILYSTITSSTFGTVPALSCTSPMTVDVRNSIIVSQGGTSPDEISCPAATVTDSATEAEVGAFDVGWFEAFNSGNYGLTAAGAGVFEVGVWHDGDPVADIEGDPRPAVDGATDFVGADVP